MMKKRLKIQKDPKPGRQPERPERPDNPERPEKPDNPDYPELLKNKVLQAAAHGRRHDVSAD